MGLSIFTIVTKAQCTKGENVNTTVIILVMLAEKYVVHLRRIQCLPLNSVLGQVLASFVLCGTYQNQLPVTVLTTGREANFYCLKAMLYDSVDAQLD